MLKPIPDFPNYFADEEGNIYSINTEHPPILRDKPRKLKPNLATGYAVVVLCKNGVKYNKKVHTLVLETFVSPRPKGMLACHGANGLKDNSLGNLSWQSHQQNGLDKYRDGTYQAGEKHYAHKLNNSQILIIKHSYGRYGHGGVSAAELGRTFNVTRQSIYRIVSHRTWKHI